MDSFILYKAEINPEIDNLKVLVAEPKEIEKEKGSTVQIQEISNDKVKSYEEENHKTLAKKDYTTFFFQLLKRHRKKVIVKMPR